MGIAWASGLNLYAAILVLGLLGATGNMSLPPALEPLQTPAVIGAAALMYSVEFFADKFPGVDSAWDTLHTFIRIPAGAVLAASAIAEVEPSLTLVAALVGGSLTAGSHLAKAGTRLLVNSSPEPFSNIGASLAEDAAAVAGLWTAVYFPVVFLVFLAGFLFLLAWWLPVLWRGLKNVCARVWSLVAPDKGKDLAEP
jgi:hypothetical protein